MVGSAPFLTLPVVCDTLYLSFDAALPPWMVELLTAARVSGGQKVGVVAIPPAPPRLYDPKIPMHWLCKHGRLDGDPLTEWMVYGQGVWEGIRLAIGKPMAAPEGAGWTYRVKVMFSSAVLWSFAGRGDGAYQTGRHVLEALTIKCEDAPPPLLFSPEPGAVRVSKLDLCCDHTGHQWSYGDMYRFAARRRRKRAKEQAEKPADKPERMDVDVYDGPTSSTYYFGARGYDCRFWKFYDKIAEAKHSGKLSWLTPIWTGRGWDGKAPIWRAEVSCGSGWLKDHGLGTLDMLPGIESALWHEATKTIRHTLGDATRMTRATTSPVWKALQHVPTELGPAAWEWKPKPPSHGGSMKQLLAMSAGCMARIEGMAKAGALLEADGETPAPWSKAPSGPLSRYEAMKAIDAAAKAKYLPRVGAEAKQAIMDAIASVCEARGIEPISMATKEAVLDELLKPKDRYRV